MKSTKWGTKAFPPLTLTAQQETEFRQLACGLVRETVTHANSFQRLPETERDLTKQKRWKPVKTRDNLTVFKERDPPKIITGTSFDTPEHQRLADDEWKTPKLLVGIGSIAGSLDDVMYGVVTPDAPAMLLKAAMMRSSLTEGAVLAQIDGPTLDEPYQFLGIKWLVKRPPVALRSFVQSRDSMFVEATGVFTRSNGDRIGYQLLHSVDLDGYGTLPGRSLTRERISSCTIFKETQDGRQVDVYARGYVEQHGKMLDSVALKAASTEFLSSSNAVECSYIKKLMWFLENPHLVAWKKDVATRSASFDARTRMSSHSSANCEGSNSFPSRHRGLTSSDDRCGGTCGRRMKERSSARQCSLCQVSLCAKCGITKKFFSVTREVKLERRQSIMCRPCVAKVRLEPVLGIAQQEIRHGHWRPSGQLQVALPVKTQASKPAVSSPSSRSVHPSPTFESRVCFGEQNASKHSSAGVSSTVVDRHEQQQSQTLNTRPVCSKTRWFRHHKKREELCDESRPVVLGESTVLSMCQSGTLSQCSTAADSALTVSPTNPLAYSWPSSVQETESFTCMDEDEESVWINVPDFMESQQERQRLWHQMTELRLAVETTYQITKRTTASCCGPSFRVSDKRTGRNAKTNAFSLR